MSSVAVQYDPDLFVLELAAAVSARLGEFVLGVSKLGASTVSGWVPVEMATFSYTSGYNPDENNTLIYDTESATISLSFWDDPEPEMLLYPSDRVRVKYAGHLLYLGTVESTALTYETDPAALAHGATHRVDFTASVLSTYAVAMGKTVSWASLPVETPINRIRHWVSVSGW